MKSRVDKAVRIKQALTQAEQAQAAFDAAKENLLKNHSKLDFVAVEERKRELNSLKIAAKKAMTAYRKAQI